MQQVTVWGQKAVRRDVPLEDVRGVADVNKYVERTADAALVKSIRKDGIQEPLILNQGLEVLSGARRLDAARKIGLERVPACVIQKPLDRDEEFRIVNEGETRTNRTIDQIVDSIIKHVGEDEIVRLNGRGKSAGKGGQLRPRLQALFPSAAKSTIDRYVFLAVTKVGEQRVRRGTIRIEFAGKDEYNFAANRLAKLDAIEKRSAPLRAKAAKLRDEQAALKAEADAVVKELQQLTRGKRIKGRTVQLAAIRAAVERSEFAREAKKA